MVGNGDAYLIVAYYDRNKWNALTQVQKDAAHAQAEQLFPEPPRELPVKAPGSSGDARIAQTFASNLFPRLNENLYQWFISLEQDVNENVRQNAFAAQDMFVDLIYATSTPQPPIGWLEIIPHDELLAYLPKISTFWQIFHIEIHELAAGWDLAVVQSKVSSPLRGDRDTFDVYKFMTPRNWS